jgi:hypothetical protein
MRVNSERGSVLALVPAGFLVLMLLAALTVDSAVTYLGRDQLHDGLAAAANDAVTAGLDNPAFYGAGTIEVDPVRAGRAACLSILAQDDAGLQHLHLWMSVNDDSVRLQGTAVIDAVFGRIVPGFGQRTVRASAQAVVTEGPLRSTAGQVRVEAPLTPLDCSIAAAGSTG